MSEWVIVDTSISDPGAYEEYKALACSMVERYGDTYRTEAENSTSSRTTSGHPPS